MAIEDLTNEQYAATELALFADAYDLAMLITSKPEEARYPKQSATTIAKLVLEIPGDHPNRVTLRQDALNFFFQGKVNTWDELSELVKLEDLHA